MSVYMCTAMCMHACVCVCVCVRERERESLCAHTYRYVCIMYICTCIFLCNEHYLNNEQHLSYRLETRRMH